MDTIKDKCMFAFYAEIQNGCQNWQQNDSWEKSPDETADTLWVTNFAEIALSHTVSEFYAEIQKVAQKCQMTLQIPLTLLKLLYLTLFSRSIYFKCIFTHLLLPKMAGKQFLGKVTR